MYTFYESPSTWAQALERKAHHGPNARAMAGGTDLLIEIERGGHAPNGQPIGVIDLTRIPNLANIRTEEIDGQTWIHLGPLVTHNQCVVSPLIQAKAFPLARACWEVGAPQIRNRGAIAGNIITASPANDTIAPLLALGATVTVESAARGTRTRALTDFITGFRQVDLAPDELLARISFPAMTAQQRGAYIKLGLRRAQAISVLNVAAILTFGSSAAPPQQGQESSQPLVQSAAISLGAVAPTVVRAGAAESYLAGKPLTDEGIAEAAQLALQSAAPIADVRASAAYRAGMIPTLVSRILQQLRDGQERAGWLEHPVMLWGDTEGKWPVAQDHSTQELAPDQAFVNGKAATLPGHMTLLDALRAVGCVGVKEGCAEGECGACTVFLDGMAIMACMTPSERARGSRVVTVEGLGDAAHLHPVQQAFVQSGGVQCGYCTPGFIMSAAKLLEERPSPTRPEAAEALTGNLCRCTGYRKIIDAVVQAGQMLPTNP
ncbi:MAG: FAD binding domain-containing protein [Caldilineaceae bacterium]|nr:FAD binding domain-containing protein [Caldilineaceae bacterium]